MVPVNFCGIIKKPLLAPAGAFILYNEIYASKNTSWEHVAEWYDRMLEGDGTYQKELILPNLLRLMNIGARDKALDLACGQGFFSRAFAAQGADVTGVDASRALIAIAKKNVTGKMRFEVGKAHALPFLKNATVDKTVIVLALQNIENPQDVLRECARVMKRGGSLALVLNHPAFRVPKASSWGWDEKAKTQYRRIDRYLSEAKVEMQMHPGSRQGDITLSFHRPLQFYFKALHKAGFAVTGLEEWNSNRKSEKGPRTKAEDTARKEIPLFACLVAEKQ